MTSLTLVLAMLVLMVSGKSIDNPAENPDRPSGMEMAVPTVVETVKRNGKSLLVPPPVQGGVVASVPSRGHSSSSARTRGARKYPAFYYRKYYDNERVGVIAESSFEDDRLSTSSEQVVSYSYLAAPNGNSRSDTSHSSSSNDVVYGTGSAAKPPSQSASAAVSLHTVEAPSLVTAESVNVPVHQHAEPSLNVIGVSSSNDVSTSLSNPVPFGHESNPSESFAVHHVPAHEQVHSQFHQLPITPPPHAPPTIFQADHNNFVIQDTTFQAHPGAPTFTIPIPIPTQHANSQRRRPFHRNNVKASSEIVEHTLPASGALSYTSYNPYDVANEHSTKKPIYKKMIEPFMKAGEKLYEMASPVLDPMFDVGSRISHSLGIQSDSEPFSLLSMNDYISRTVDGGGVPVVAGVAALTAIAIGAIAVASSSNVTIGKRSLDNPMEDFMYQMLDPYPTREPTLLDRLEQYTSWTDSKCSKRIFCDVMTYTGDDYLYTIEKRLEMFLRILNRGSAEESALKKTADDVMSAVRNHNCGLFSCGGSGVDTAQVSHSSSGPR
ncbi:uncharacterized protein [Palaemon carinicauda]|uniref:uncharacterized protein isoform X3 n=1 Tax=Palaemon carinicauda TaxID=392227 RepID=UPI0035B5CD2D